MEILEDGLLRLIVERLRASQDRKSFSLVCKRWCRVEGLQRSRLRVLQPHRLSNFLPRFPNLLTLESSEVMTDVLIQLVSKTFRNIQVLNLTRKESVRALPDWNGLGDWDNDMDGLDYWGLLYHWYDKHGWDGIDDYHIDVMARACPNLNEVYLRGRWTIGGLGVSILCNHAPNLAVLDLGKCFLVDEEALDDIANAKSLQVLNLEGCLITDSGLASMAKGYVSGTLRKLVISGCNGITDAGLLELSQMRVLEELDLSRCGCKVTDTGGLAIAVLTDLKKLNLSWLVNISNATLIALAKNCNNLVALDLTGCETITGDGIREFATHKSLEKLALASCYNIDGESTELTVLGCQTLSLIVLDKAYRMSMPMAMQENISRTCRLEWQ